MTNDATARPARRAVHHDRPRRHRRPRPGRGDRLLRPGLRRAVGARGDQRGAGRPRGDARRRRRRHPHPAARPADAGVDDREVHRPLRPGPAAAGLPGRRRRGGQRDPARARACGCSTTPPSAAPPTAGSTSSTPRTPAACSSSWSSPPTGPLTRTRRYRLPTGNIRRTAPPLRADDDPGVRVNEIRDAILADQLDAVAGLAVPESYRAVLVRKDEQDMFEGLERQGEGPAQVAARRGGAPPPSSARVRRSSPSWRRR